MALIRWEPAREVRTVRSDFDRLFSSVFDTSTFGIDAGRLDAPRPFAPAIDIVETEQEYLIRADLPGLSSDVLNLEIEDGLLTLSGERQNEQATGAGSYVRRERASGSFSRSIRLPKGIDPAGVSADFTHGVLEIRIPRPAAAKPHRVAIGSTVAAAAPTTIASEAQA